MCFLCGINCAVRVKRKWAWQGPCWAWWEEVYCMCCKKLIGAHWAKNC